MAKNYRLISGDSNHVNSQLTVISAKAREGGPVEKPILMTAVFAQPAQAQAAHVGATVLYVILEGEN